MANSLILAEQRRSQYPRSPLLFRGVLRLVYEFAMANNRLHPTRKSGAASGAGFGMGVAAFAVG